MTTLSAVQVDVNTTSDQINAQLITLTEKYLGNKEYILSGTSTGYIGAEIAPMAPWANLANRYFPTVATLPQSGINIKSKTQLGGYFTPNMLGASTYLAENITPYVNVTAISGGNIYKYIDPTVFNKGRGLTLNDQDNVITHVENLNWMKSVNTGTAFDGQIVGSDTYQKFIPYQSNYETTKIDSNGVISIKNDFEFWTGDKKNIWLTTNKFTQEDWLKYFDIASRVKNLLISPAGQELYCWQTDVYGNQYALYKTPTTSRTIYNMQNTYGQLWVRTVDGTIYTAVSALSSVYNKYVNNAAIYSQLQSNNIKNIELFYDTLVFELSGHTIYEKITFDYPSCTIKPYSVDFLPLDYNQQVSTRLLSSSSLTGVNVSSYADVYYGGNWYNEANKTIIACLLLSASVVSTDVSTASARGLIVPVLYQYDINHPGNRTRIYPTNSTDYNLYLYYDKWAVTQNTELVQNLTYMEAPVITYNRDALSYVISFIGFVNQTFNIISYTTRESLTNKIITDDALNPIVTDNNATIIAV